MSIKFVIALLLLPALPSAVVAQSSGTGASTQTRAQISSQLSGRSASSSGSVGAVQSSRGSGNNSSVNTIDSNLQVQGNYAGSTSDGDASVEPLHLTLAGAVQRGLRFNLGGVGAVASERQARGQRLSALSQLLPSISASLSETVAQANLAAQGLSNINLPGGASFPKIVGPYNYFDLQGKANLPIFDLVAQRNYKAAKTAAEAATYNVQDARDLVVLAVGGSYFQTLAAVARVDSARAQLNYAEATYRQSVAQFDAGTAAKLDSTRSLVELETQRERLTSVEAELEKQKLTLARTLGVNLSRPVVLDEAMSFQPSPIPTLEDMLSSARRTRSDLRAAEAQLRAAQFTAKAAAAERYPSLGAQGYYGAQGTQPTNSHGVFSASATLTIPIFDGRRTEADRLQASAEVAQRLAEYQDQLGRVELDVRQSLINLRTAAQQVAVAERNRRQARDNLGQSQDRLAAGAADTVEVVQAQQTLATAEEDYISGLYSHNLAKLSLARATGQANTDWKAWLDGSGSATSNNEKDNPEQKKREEKQ